MDNSEIWVDRKDFKDTTIVTTELGRLVDGDIRVRIDKFGLTANNVGYALSGDMIGYWRYFPADGRRGKVPAWGIAEVIESKSADIEPGERLYGFFPMASHLDLTPAILRLAPLKMWQRIVNRCQNCITNITALVLNLNISKLWKMSDACCFHYL